LIKQVQTIEIPSVKLLTNASWQASASMLKSEILKMINLIDSAMKEEPDPYKGEIWAELFMEKIKQYPVDV